MKDFYPVFVHLATSIGFLLLSLVLFLAVYPAPEIGVKGYALLILLYCAVAYYHTVTRFPGSIRYRLIRLSAFALLIPVVAYFSLQFSIFTERKEPDYLSLLFLFLGYRVLDVASLYVFKRHFKRSA